MTMMMMMMIASSATNGSGIRNCVELLPQSRGRWNTGGRMLSAAGTSTSSSYRPLSPRLRFRIEAAAAATAAAAEGEGGGGGGGGYTRLNKFDYR